MEKEIADPPDAGSPLPRQDFIAALTIDWTGRLVACRWLWPATPDREKLLVDPILEDTPLASAEWAILFAYMHRRFGLPNAGRDNYKDLSAAWLLTSPDPDLFLLVGPSLSGAWFCFTPYLRTDKGGFLRGLDIPKERRAELGAAYRVVLLDLLRPVCIRDAHINALGELDDDDPLLEFDEDADRYLFEVDQHSSCGWASPPGLFGGEEWGKFCELVSDLGRGDIAAGRTAAIDALSKLREAPALAAPEGDLRHE